MSVDTLDRFTAKYQVDEAGCWRWIAAQNRQGYGCFRVNRQTYLAHRWAYEHLVGPIPDGLELDHLCRAPACVNPAHLEAVTHQENMRRGQMGYRSVNYHEKMDCVRGHPFNEANTYVSIRDGRPRRACRACRALGMREARAA